MTQANARILVVDDIQQNVKLLVDMLGAEGYEPISASNGQEALEKLEAQYPDLVLLDVMMPGMDGYEVCRRIRKNPATQMMPVVMVTALDPMTERVKGIDAGADDFLGKPVNIQELLARVRSLLRVKQFHDTIQRQKEELAELNRSLEGRVAQQVAQIERMNTLKRFLPPNLAEMIVDGSVSDPLKPHRREISVVFVDLRGFTSFASDSEPEEVMSVLKEYHAEMGSIIIEHEGTIDRFAGDGIMIIFNDPVPIPEPGQQAVRMAIAMRSKMEELSGRWRKKGYDLDCGYGIASGYATIGAIGFEGRWDYSAIGSVPNLASRLCDEAKGGQIIICQKTLASVEDIITSEPLKKMKLKGFVHPVASHSVLSVRGMSH